MEKAEVIKAFHLMWDNYPESAMLIDKKRNIIAANKVAPSTGRIEGNKCALVEPLENSTRAAGQKKRGRMVKPVIVKKSVN